DCFTVFEILIFLRVENSFNILIQRPDPVFMVPVKFHGKLQEFADGFFIGYFCKLHLEQYQKQVKSTAMRAISPNILLNCRKLFRKPALLSAYFTTRFLCRPPSRTTRNSISLTRKLL